MTRRRSGIILAAVVSISLCVLNAAQPGSSTPALVISPSVVSSYVVRNGALVLLVLWRGSPGWFRAGNASGGAGSSGTQGGIHFRYGELSFSVDLDYVAQTARLLGQQVSLTDANVILVDKADSRPVIVGLKHIDPAVPSDRNVVPGFLRPHPDLIAFLECDVTPAPRTRAVMVIFCDEVRNH